MRRIGLFLAGVSVLLLALPALAQEPEGAVGRVYYLKAKAGMEQQFEAAVKKHIDWHRRQNDPWTFYWWQAETGEQFGQYVVGTFEHRWEDFDGRAALDAADDADYAANVAQFVESVRGIIVAGLPQVSLPLAGGEGPTPLSSVITFHLNMGGEAEFPYVIRKFHQAIQKTNWPRNYLWYALANGGEHPTYYLVLPHANWAGFKPPAKPFPVMLEEAYGREEAAALLKQLSKLIHCQRSQVLRYRADLSYRPAAR